MAWFEIQPRDIWLFRDGKPFSDGEDRQAYSMFPPTPLTVQGALRQKISESLGVALWQYKKASNEEKTTQTAYDAVKYIGKHGTKTDYGKFSMSGPFISLRVSDDEVVPLFAAPADLLRNDKTNDFYISKPGLSFINDLGNRFAFPEIIEGYENLPGYWMTENSFEAYLNNSTPDGSQFYDESDDNSDDEEEKMGPLEVYNMGKSILPGSLIYGKESRVGVSTNSQTSTGEDGQLYQIQFVRPQKGIGLLTEVNDDIPEDLLDGTLTLGGEQRHGIVKKVDKIDLPSKEMTTRFKVIFLTPAYFTDGWQPKDGDWKKVFGHSVKLESANLYRPVKIGGWSNHTNTARAMYNYVAPGSVYYFSTETPFELPEKLTQEPDTLNIKDLGFGRYAIGEW